MTGAAATRAFTVTLQFHGELLFFLRRGDAGRPVVRVLREKTSVKDAIEACGVPHPEVDLILCDGAPVDFAFQLVRDVVLEVYAVGAGGDARADQRLQRRQVTRFLADGHLGKLARDLRLIGFDTAYRADAADHTLARTAAAEERALLTRDRRLLMHGLVRDGYCPRSDDPNEQIIEVLRRFDLHERLAPWTRCLACNGLLHRVEKADVIGQLEPLTRMYYKEFRRCGGCGKIYWSGSHFGKLQARIEQLRARLDRSPNVDTSE